MGDLWWKLLLSAAFALQASGASAEKLCNYNNPASPDYCTNADLNEQKARFRSVNDAYTANMTSDADRRWRGTLLDQMRARLTTCGNNVAQVIGCEFDVYRWASDTLQGRLEQKVRVPAELQTEAQDIEAQDAASAAGGLEATDISEPLDQSESSAAAASQSAEPDADDSESLEDDLNNQSVSSPDPIRIITTVLPILAILLLMAFRTYKGYSGIKERKFLLFSIYCSAGIIADIIWGSVGGLWFFYFPGIPIAIWGPKITAYPIRRLLLRYYGFNGHDLEEEFRSWTTRHGAFWANFRYGAIESTLSREQRALGQLLPHRSLGKCRAGVGHLEAECGDCDVIGCFEPECANHNFSDNNTCLQCGHKASLRGGGY